jgi:uncharacterized protein YbaR (Trm112 family)
MDKATGSTVTLDPLLVEILACPVDKGPLYYFEDEDSLYNPRLRRRYKVKDGIPDMLIEDSEEVVSEEHERLVKKAEADGIGLNFAPAAEG